MEQQRIQDVWVVGPPGAPEAIHQLRQGNPLLPTLTHPLDRKNFGQILGISLARQGATENKETV